MNSLVTYSSYGANSSGSSGEKIYKNITLAQEGFVNGWYNIYTCEKNVVSATCHANITYLCPAALIDVFNDTSYYNLQFESTMESPVPVASDTNGTAIFTVFYASNKKLFATLRVRYHDNVIEMGWIRADGTISSARTIATIHLWIVV